MFVCVCVVKEHIYALLLDEHHEPVRLELLCYAYTATQCYSSLVLH